jgi:multiple antibiotic resistance protein
MPASVREISEFGLLSFTSIFFLVDPFAVIPTFLAITEGADALERKRMARKSGWTCLIVLCGFALTGSLIFRLFGITLPAFKIAGGLILLQIGLDMLQARRSSQNETPGEAAEGAAKEDASIIPLGIPMLAGPGTISTVMVLIGESHEWWEHAIIYGSIIISSLISYVVLAEADRVRGFLGETGIRILMRLMGLLLTALAVQFVLNGLTDLGLIKFTLGQG